jgi:very-short-patch-repair endonuclease
MCKELMLIVEVDGILTISKKPSKKDEIRQKNLESAGFTVLRFSDEEVLNNIHAVFLSGRLD